jgi:magnesium transporter
VPTIPDLPETLDQVVQIEGAPKRQPGTSHLRVLAFGPDDTGPREIAWDAVPDLLRDAATFIWADLSEYSEPDLQMIASTLGLQPSTVFTIRSTWQRPTLTNMSDYFFVSATVPRLNTADYRILAGELDLCVSPHFVLSAHRLPLPFGDQVWERAQQNPHLVRADAAYLLYLVLDELLIYAEDLNRKIQSQSELLEEQALSDVGDSFLEDLLHFKRYIFGLTELIDQHREVFIGFFRPDFTGLAGDEVEGYFRDLQVRLAHLLSMLNAAKESVNSAFNIYVSHMSHRTNQIIKVLTIVSTLIFPATLIVALFGSSVQSEMPGLRHVWFWLMLISMVVLCGVLFATFVRLGWIATRRSRNPLQL